MEFKRFYDVSLLLEDFTLDETVGENDLLPANNLSKKVSDILGLRGTFRKDFTHQVRKPRTDEYSQVVVQFIGHFYNRITQRNINTRSVIIGLMTFVERHIKELASTFNKAAHVEGIIKIKLDEKIKNEEGDLSDMLNVTYRYSTFGEPSPKKHVLTFITAKVKDNFKQNAPPVHGETINIDYQV